MKKLQLLKLSLAAALLVPFLVFAIGVSHGVQMINAVGKNVAAGDCSKNSAFAACCRLFVPGMIACHWLSGWPLAALTG